MRKSGCAEHQGQAKRDARQRIFRKHLRSENGGALRVNGNRLFDQRRKIVSERSPGEECYEHSSEEQQHRFHHLDPCCRDHPADHDAEDHQGADQHDCGGITQAEHQLDDLARADHLRNQVTDDEDKRNHGDQGTYFSFVEAVAQRVGHRITAEIA